MKFDEKISPHELRTLCEKLSEDDSSDDFDIDDIMYTEEGQLNECCLILASYSCYHCIQTPTMGQLC